MKNLFFILLTGLLLFAGCEREEIDVPANTDFPPSIVSSSPSAGGTSVLDGFTVSVYFADGTTSPLQSATVTILDSTGAELISRTESLEGTSDSLIIPADQFDPTVFVAAEGYEMLTTVSDVKGQTTESRFNFSLSNQAFAANHAEIYIAGNFNGWQGVNHPLTLVADHTWEIEGITLINDDGARQWKIKNTPDFTGEDWGDPDCDGIMTSNMATGSVDNTDCDVPAVPVRVRFNDMELSYSIQPLVTFASNVSGLFLLGTFNDFEGNANQFSMVSDNTWVAEEVLIAPGDRYKFAEMPDLMGTVFGDNENDGVAEAFGSNIVFDGDQEAFYRFTFNDQTLEYSSEFVRLPSMGLIGDALPNGFDGPDTDMDDSDGDGIFTLIVQLSDGPVKFRTNDSWAVNWGGDDFPSGAAVPNGPNIDVTAGLYRVSINTNDLTYNFVEITSIGVIGDATPGGWSDDTDLTLQDDGLWFAQLALAGGEAKFRANDAWDINWGGSDFPGGNSTIEGPNIPIDEGTYDITFDPITGAYNFGPEGSYGDDGFSSVGILGTATPGQWVDDTDMIDNGDGTYELLIGLGEGQVKFRADNSWDNNWGGSEFPSGSTIFNDGGANIDVTPGLYFVTLDLNANTYSFEPASLGIL
ncbi:MAG: hypothetical protein AAGF87_13775, partial [Bacteroidota bacterium]